MQTAPRCRTLKSFDCPSIPSADIILHDARRDVFCESIIDCKGSSLWFSFARFRSRATRIVRLHWSSSMASCALAIFHAK